MTREKLLVVWIGIVVLVGVFMVPCTIMVNHYNDTERDRSVACTKLHGNYAHGGCLWTEVRR